MFFAIELQTSRVNFLPHRQGLFKPSKPSIRDRKIALRDENVVAANVADAAFYELAREAFMGRRLACHGKSS